MVMGLFDSKEFNERAKQEKAERKANNAKILDYFSKHSDYIVDKLYFDDKNEKLFINKLFPADRSKDVFNYNEIISFTPIFEGGKKRKHHGITRAVVGGVLAGPVGALVGAGTGGKDFDTVSSLGFMIHLTDNRSEKYMLLTSETKIKSIVGGQYMDDYNKISAKLDQILAAKEPQASNSSRSDADELRKFKGLLDDGIISQAEFDEKKKELLGL